MKLPLISGNTFFIDNSSMEYLHTCPRSAEYFILQRRISSADKVALNFGGAMHAALEHRYTNYGEIVDGNCLPGMYRILDDWFANKPNPEDDFRQPGYAKNVIAGYMEKYATEEFSVLEGNGKPMVEMSFAVPLATIRNVNVVFTGRIDLSVMCDGKLWLPDHKTSVMLGPQMIKEQKMSSQWKGYCWAFRETTGRTPYGAIINGIRVRPPNITVKGQEKRRDVVPDDFQRFRLILEDHHIDEWKANTIDILTDFINDVTTKSSLPMKTKWCVGKYGPCPYYEVCELPPSSRNAMLSSGLFMDNTWSPLQQTKQQNNEKPT